MRQYRPSMATVLFQQRIDVSFRRILGSKVWGFVARARRLLHALNCNAAKGSLLFNDLSIVAGLRNISFSRRLN